MSAFVSKCALNGRSHRLVQYFPAPIFCQHTNTSPYKIGHKFAHCLEIRKNLAATLYVQLPMNPKLLT